MEPSTARPLTLVEIQGRTFAWTPEAGLDPEAVLTVRAWIYREALGLMWAARVFGVGLDDLAQAGFLGALRAARSWDPQYNVRFLSYAAFFIRAQMLNCMDGDIALPVKIRLWDRVALQSLVSLDWPDAKGDSLSDRLPAPEPEIHDGRAVHEVLGVLPEEDRRLLKRYFGLAGEEPASLRALGAEQGVSGQTMFSRLHSALSRARAHLNRRG